MITNNAMEKLGMTTIEQTGWTKECDDTDALLRGLGLEPEKYRTEGGALNVTKALNALGRPTTEAMLTTDDVPIEKRGVLCGICSKIVNEAKAAAHCAEHEAASRDRNANVFTPDVETEVASRG